MTGAGGFTGTHMISPFWLGGQLVFLSFGRRPDQGGVIWLYRIDDRTEEFDPPWETLAETIRLKLRVGKTPHAGRNTPHHRPGCPENGGILYNRCGTHGGDYPVGSVRRL